MIFKGIKSIRLSDEQAKQVHLVVNLNPEIYGSASHFVRCAIIKLLRENHPEVYMRNAKRNKI